MYIKKRIIEQVIELFQKNKEIRNNRMETIGYIITHHYSTWCGGGNINISVKLMFDIDRAFRFVQQHIPELRGDTWAQRQKRGGEAGGAAYKKYIKEVSNQLKLKFEETP